MHADTLWKHGVKLILTTLLATKYTLCKTISQCLHGVCSVVCTFKKGADSQAKLVRVLQGTVVDVAVDLRKSSPTYGHYVMVELSAENKRQLFIPRGFAHGFQVLSDTAVFTYKVDNRYAPESECSIRYDDPTIDIDWPIKGDDVVLSEKDLKHAVSFEAAEKF